MHKIIIIFYKLRQAIRNFLQFTDIKEYKKLQAQKIRLQISLEQLYRVLNRQLEKNDRVLETAEQKRLRSRIETKLMENTEQTCELVKSSVILRILTKLGV